ncbi:conserved hypothetical protein [Histoplasma capsulatum var. duboisii H88]|uniref:C6 transcription factor n=2 Tax=Ajellomyces capsulatus TaxID=5037 RepID=F0UTY6_AJEC8|nr:conserved hypothetical protein [Histoplasma capsulatum H143]EGC49363.1 conserved hypothetical protein [Histoplasma capsulatum var. duboisii H88]QSS57800.1 C6 transcription factor [Histoplasma capsulatum var. duboisii H88]
MASQTPEPPPKVRRGPRGNKRARLVCLRCHEKKIKCDLQVNNSECESPRCSRCEIAGYECRIRPSKRGAGNRASVRHSSLDDFDTVDSLPIVSLPNDPTSKSTPSNHSQVHVKTEPSVHCVVTDDRMATESTSHFSGGIGRPAISYPSSPEGIRQPTSQFPSARTASLPVKTHDSGQAQNALYSSGSGLLQILDNSAAMGQLNSSQPVLQPVDLPPPALQESFMDTYFQFCYTWCPILDNSTLFPEQEESSSVLLNQALALLGSRIQPSVLQQVPPIVYYNRAKALFLGNHESNPITCMKALLLFYWWGSAPNSPSLDTVWWWTGVAIRLAQQIGLHREPTPGQVMRPNESPGLRRRLWWTLFARERLTSICQGRPCIIDPSDCNVREPSPEDFPEPKDHFRVQTFIYWVRLSSVVGKVAKYLLQKKETTQFPGHLARELVDWVQSLPEPLRLPIATNRTTPFNRDVHQLHLPYLTTITLLYLTKSSQPLRKAYTTAVLSASCVARIFEDFLTRGSIRFLQGMGVWHIAVAILALLHARRIQTFTTTADSHIKILRIALKEMATMWPSASMLDQAFDGLLASNQFAVSEERSPTLTMDVRPINSLSELADLATGTLINATDFYPFATTQTSPLVEILLTQNTTMIFTDLEWPCDISSQLHDLLDSFGGV